METDMDLLKLIVGLAAAVAFVAAIWLVHKEGVSAGRAEVMAEWRTEKAEQQRIKQEAALKAREREQAAQFAADRIRQEKDREIADINRRHAAHVDSLRKRPDRPADYLPAPAQTADTGPAAGCGADQLYRQDAAAALGIARDADLVRIALQQCHAQYQAAGDAAEPASH